MLQLFLGVVFLVASMTSDSLINYAVHLFETRHLNSNNIYISEKILRELTQKETNNLIANYKLSQIYFTLADRSLNMSEKIKYFTLGLEYAQKAIAIDSGSVWAHFWYLANFGALTQQKGIFNSLSAVSEVKKRIETLLRLDYNNVWSLNAQANIYYELPKVLGGNVDKSIEILNRALTIDSNYSILYISIAKSYIKKKNFSKAKFYLHKLLSLENPWPIADYIIDHKPTALKLLKEIEAK